MDLDELQHKFDHMEDEDHDTKFVEEKIVEILRNRDGNRSN